MIQDELKRAAAQAAIEQAPMDAVIGVGSGSTVNYFIAALAALHNRIEAAVPASEASAARLRQAGIRIADLNNVAELAIYVDGADEISRHLMMIKGGGAALTREKIIAQAARKFVCIADESKWVDALGRFPVPLEVIPMARELVAREMVKLGGEPRWRESVITDNGNIILDVHQLKIPDPVALESAMNQIPGVVTCGIFARRPADLLLLATAKGVKHYT